jgi:hypothetical protein
MWVWVWVGLGFSKCKCMGGSAPGPSSRQRQPPAPAARLVSRQPPAARPARDLGLAHDTWVCGALCSSRETTPTPRRRGPLLSQQAAAPHQGVHQLSTGPTRLPIGATETAEPEPEPEPSASVKNGAGDGAGTAGTADLAHRPIPSHPVPSSSGLLMSAQSNTSQRNTSPPPHACVRHPTHATA